MSRKMYQENLVKSNPITSEDVVCPITFLLDVLSPKWTVEILRELFIEPVRTRRFLKLVPGLNMKTLRQRLQVLEDYGLAKRIVFPDRPLRVEYSLTAKGRDLYRVLVSLKLLASQWLGSTCRCPFDEGFTGETACPHQPQAHSPAPQA